MLDSIKDVDKMLRSSSFSKTGAEVTRFQREDLELLAMGALEKYEEGIAMMAHNSIPLRLHTLIIEENAHPGRVYSALDKSWVWTDKRVFDFMYVHKLEQMPLGVNEPDVGFIAKWRLAINK